MGSPDRINLTVYINTTQILTQFIDKKSKIISPSARPHTFINDSAYVRLGWADKLKNKLKYYSLALITILYY